MTTVASSNNKVVTTDLSVTYNSAYNDGGWYEVTRTAAKEYSFVDITQEAAYSIASDKVAKYTRRYSVISNSSQSDAVPTQATVLFCSSDIVPRRASGSAWRVDINVTEKDVKIISGSTQPTRAQIVAMFSAENARDYD